MQQAGDRSAALILACARAVKVVCTFSLSIALSSHGSQASEFSQGAAPQLKSELQTEATQSRGYVDALRLSVISRDGPSDKKPESQGMSLSHGRVRISYPFWVQERVRGGSYVPQSFERTLTDIERAFSDGAYFDRHRKGQC